MDKHRIENITANQINLNNLIIELKELAVRGLVQMFDDERQLFCFKVKRNDTGIKKEGFSLRYTLISLLGLHQYESYGGYSPINICNASKVLLEGKIRPDNIGDIGLLLWLYAKILPNQLDRVYNQLDINSALKQYSDSYQGKTTELSWFLTGLSYIALAPIQKPKGLDDLSIRVYKMIKENYGGKGIFCHQKRNTITGILRGRVGCFADQVYPIYAFSQFTKAYNCKEAMDIATECGNTICELQGPLGQWWWHYDSITGKILGRYPVYSVHQDGMAPMALFALSKVIGLDFSNYIFKGLEWITGKNELNYNLIDSSRSVIWRNLYRQKYKKYYDEITSIFYFSDNQRILKDLHVLFECWSYHLGWLLYAFAGRTQR